MKLIHSLISISPNGDNLKISLRSLDGKNKINLKPVENNIRGHITATRIQEAILSGLIQIESVEPCLGNIPDAPTMLIGEKL